MKTYRYTDETGAVVHVIDADGISRSSMLASALPQGTQVLPYVAPPPAVPASVTRRQAKQALLLAGLLNNVQPAIDAIQDATQRALIQIEWDDSQVFERRRPALIALGTALGLSSAQLDSLFITAAQL